MSKKQFRIKKLIELRENLGMGRTYDAQPQQVIFLKHNLKKLIEIVDTLLIADGVHNHIVVTEQLHNPFFQQGK